MPDQTPEENMPQHIVVIMDGNRRFGGTSAARLTGFIDLSAVN
jgi:undecaprenyl pyrophosphate synthase